MKKMLIWGTLFYCLFASFAYARHHRDFDNNGNLPGGSYRDSCRQCTMTGNVLSCVCEGRRGRTKNTILYIGPQCGQVGNDNGTLRCGGSNDGAPERLRGLRFEVQTSSIFSQSDAERACPMACDDARGRWTGNWRTIRHGNAATCECKRQ